MAQKIFRARIVIDRTPSGRASRSPLSALVVTKASTLAHTRTEATPTAPSATKVFRIIQVKEVPIALAVTRAKPRQP